MQLLQVKHHFKKLKKYIHNHLFILQYNIIQGFVFMKIFQKSYTLVFIPTNNTFIKEFNYFRVMV